MARIRRRASSEDSYTESPHTTTARPRSHAAHPKVTTAAGAGAAAGASPKRRKVHSSSHSGPKDVTLGSTLAGRRKKKPRNVRAGHCANCYCNEKETDLWRNNVTSTDTSGRSGNMVCNACGLWRKEHHTSRPPYLWKHFKHRSPPEHLYGTVSEAFGWGRTNGASKVNRPPWMAEAVADSGLHTPVHTPSPSDVDGVVSARELTEDPLTSTDESELEEPDSDMELAVVLMSLSTGFQHQVPLPPTTSAPASTTVLPAAAAAPVTPPPAVASPSLSAYDPTPSRAAPPPPPAVPEHISCRLFDDALYMRYEPHWISRTRSPSTGVSTTPRPKARRMSSMPDVARLNLHGLSRVASNALQLVNMENNSVAGPSASASEPQSPTVVRPFLGNIVNREEYQQLHGGRYDYQAPRSYSPAESLPALSRNASYSTTAGGDEYGLGTPSSLLPSPMSRPNDEFPWGAQAQMQAQMQQAQAGKVCDQQAQIRTQAYMHEHQYGYRRY